LFDLPETVFASWSLKGVNNTNFANTMQKFKHYLSTIDIAKDELPDETELAGILSIQQKLNEKYDEYLPEDLLTKICSLLK
jgi:hypothetical protein